MLPLFCGKSFLPEMIRNGGKGKDDKKDTGKQGKATVAKSYEKKKQDCERAVIKRLLEKHGEYHKELKATLSGDEWIKAEGDKLPVNYIYYTIYNRNHDKMTYKNSRITDKRVTDENVKHLVDCARARLKIENENTNVLKK